jgi:hypothetical protein
MSQRETDVERLKALSILGVTITNTAVDSFAHKITLTLSQPEIVASVYVPIKNFTTFGDYHESRGSISENREFVGVKWITSVRVKELTSWYDAYNISVTLALRDNSSFAADENMLVGQLEAQRTIVRPIFDIMLGAEPLHHPYPRRSRKIFWSVLQARHYFEGSQDIKVVRSPALNAALSQEKAVAETAS